MELALLLTCSGLTYPEVSSKVYRDSFCQMGSSVLLPWVIYFEAFYLHVVYPVLTNKEMTTKSQRYNCFTKYGGNAIPKHAGPEAKGTNPTTGLTLLWAHNPFRGNFNHWQVSWKEAGHSSRLRKTFQSVNVHTHTHTRTHTHTHTHLYSTMFWCFMGCCCYF